MKYLFLILITGLAQLGTAQNFWTAINSGNLKRSPGDKKFFAPDEVGYYALDLNTMREYLDSAPKENSGSGLKLMLPIPEMELLSFNVYKSQVMMPGLSKKYPSIRSFKGYAKDKSIIVRFDLSVKGFHCFIKTRKGAVFIDPVSSAKTKVYQVYYAQNEKITAELLPLSCGTETPGDYPFDLYTGDYEIEIDRSKSLKSIQDPISLRIYRLAISCTGEWGASNGSSVEEALSAINTTVNWLNVVFESELAIRVMLIDQNDQLIFLDGASDPFDSPTSGNSLLSMNTNVINNIVGFNSYDIGHIYSDRCFDVGGVAFIGATCAGNKGAGVSCQNNKSLNYFTLNITAHEIGHQFGANHSFNNCDGNENFGTAYEPGSGSTIMSYAGLCGSNNIQASSDNYYHSISLQEIFNYTRNGNGDSCPQKMETKNTTPVATTGYENGFVIPVLTAFELEGTATDNEDNNLSYSWDQFNLGPQSNLGTPLGNAPSFRSRKPTNNPQRIFPELSKILNNSHDITEVIPDVSRNLKFRFIVRDNSPEGGAVDWIEVNFGSNISAGPFEIISHNEEEQLSIGDEVNIMWDVANTDKTPVNCQYVKILMSEDGGHSFPHILRDKTLNDGTENIIIPNTPSDSIRFKIKAYNNIFFDINNTNLSIAEPLSPGYYVEVSAPVDGVCIPAVIEIPIETIGFQDYNESIEFEITAGLPENTTFQFEPQQIIVDQATNLILDFSNVMISGEFDVTLRSVSSALDTLFRNLNLNLTNTGFNEIILISPGNGMSSVSGLPSFNWLPTDFAVSYNIEIADNPSFQTNNIFEINQISDQNYVPEKTLEINELYYWRVNASNNCAQSNFSEISAFHTEVLSCSETMSSDPPVNISASGTRTVEAGIEFATPGTIRDVNVIKIMGNHEQVSDLTMSLISPEGTVAILFDRSCGNLANFDMGFDDDAPVDIDCPVTGGVRFKPIDSLNIFYGEGAMGMWTLRIEDKSPGFGGALNKFVLELCTDVQIDNPFLTNNNPLQTPPGISTRIKEDLLLTEDQNNSPNELLYTLVSVPSAGELYIDNELLKIGDQFTQKNINDQLFRYVHDGSAVEEDQFLFVVEDGEGGWIKITVFQIQIDEDFTSSVKDNTEDLQSIRIYPNPMDDMMTLEFVKPIPSKMNLIIYSLTGQKMVSHFTRSNNKIEIETSSLTNGLYVLKMETENGLSLKKFVVQH